MIFISSDRDSEKFVECFAKMPWLAIHRRIIGGHFSYAGLRFDSFPRVVEIGPSGRTVNMDAGKAIEVLGAEAFPFMHLGDLIHK